MATRAQVTTAIVGALSNRDGITYVTTDVENFMKVGGAQLPACYVSMETVESTYVAYDSATAVDRNDVVEATITGWVRKPVRDDVITAVNNLAVDIRLAIENDSTLHGYVNMVELQSAVTEPSRLDNVGSVTVTYRMDYDYNHNSP